MLFRFYVFRSVRVFLRAFRFYGVAVEFIELQTHNAVVVLFRLSSAHWCRSNQMEFNRLLVRACAEVAQAENGDIKTFRAHSIGFLRCRRAAFSSAISHHILSSVLLVAIVFGDSVCLSVCLSVLSPTMGHRRRFNSDERQTLKRRVPRRHSQH